MAQMQSKAGFDSRSRDIRRRVDVIQKKLADLQELGIPCAFCYSSIRNTGSLFTLGDKRITDVIERHKNEILRNLIDGSFEQPDPVTKEIHLILPPLPNTLDQLSRHTMQSLIIGILKDLGVKWSDPKPAWWPLEIPFVPPRSVPENFTGNWTQALKKVIESVYSYFSYDVDTYVAGNLDCSLEEGESESSMSDIESKVNEKQPHHASSTHAADVSPKKQSNRVSSFTVENILNSPNSAGISNSSHSSLRVGDESSPALQTTYSWPSVKYTKFTMLSPASMKNGSKSRSGNGSSWVQNMEFSSNVIKGGESRGPSSSKTATNPPSNTLTSVISGESGSLPNPVVRPSEPPTRQDRSSTLGSSEYHFPPSHRYIVLLPPNSKTVGTGAQSSGEVDSPAPTALSHSPPAMQSSDCTPTPTQPALSPSMPHIYSSSQAAAEQGYRPIAPKTEAMKMAETQALKNPNAEGSSKKSKMSKKSLSKHPRLRFHMTTVVKKAKRRNATTSMTAPPPSLCSPNGTSSSAGRQTLGAGESFRPIAPKAHTITATPNKHSSEHSTDQSSTMPVSSTEQEPSPQTDVSVPQTSVLKDSGFHLQLVKQTLSNPSNAGARSSQRSRRGSSRGRGARGYTKRKRGLTFHLYEDPATAFRAKRTRQH